MKILVTGASGFVGSQLCPYLVERGHEVVAVVRSAGTAPTGTSELVIDNIGAETNWDAQLAGIDAVIHLAARVHVMRDNSDDPLLEFRKVNVAGTNALAVAAARQKVKRFVFLSSIKVNGERTDLHPFTVADIPDPQDDYGVSKFEAETELRELEAKTGIEVVIIRTPLVYGPNVGGNFVRILGLASSRVPLPFGSVRNRRTMISIWNLVDLLERAATEPEASGALLLAGDARSPSTAELVRTLRAATGRRPAVFAFPTALMTTVGRLTARSDVVNRLLDSLEVEAGSSSNSWRWTPRYSFEDGVSRTAEWFRTHHSALTREAHDENRDR